MAILASLARAATGLSRCRAAKSLFAKHRFVSTAEARSVRLLRDWLSPGQRAQLADTGYFDVVGGESGRRYRIFSGTSLNVCELDERGRVRCGWCFVPIGELPIGDVMLAQKFALESCESSALAVARQFVPHGFFFRPRRLFR